jgi:5-methyltetrahydropteroyltriglutamate--homocysteine methyltransferase
MRQSECVAELTTVPVSQVSVEAAQSHLDCAVLSALRGKTIVLGVIDLSTEAVESPELVAARIRRALPYVDPARLVVAPDCGMKYLTRAAAYGKMRAMVAGAEIIRLELGL